MHGHALFGEVAPLLPFLPVLAEILFWVGCAVFIVLCILIVKALFGVVGGTIGKLPVVGGWINSPLHSLEHKIVGVMSDGLATVDARIGASFHALARLADWLGREIERHANLLATLATLTLGGALSAPLLALLQRLTHRTDTLTTSQEATVRRLITAEKRLQHGIGDDVLPKIKTLDNEVAHVIGKELPAIRARERELERGAGSTWKWIRAHPGTIASGAFAGAVAWALGRLGASWVRCNPFASNAKRLCGLNPAFLEALLTGAIAIFGTVSLVDMANEMINLEGEIVNTMTGFFREIADVPRRTAKQQGF